MAISKVIFNGVTQMDVTGNTVTSSTLVSPETATKADGTEITGSLVAKSQSDLTASGATVTVPAGVYSTQATKSVSSGTATSASSISATGASVSTGTNTVTLSKSVSNTPRITTAGYISSGTAGNSSVSLTASITTKAATTYYPSTSDQTISSSTYLTGTQTIKGVLLTNLEAGNIKKDVVVKVGDSADDDRVTSVTGTYEGSGSSKNVQIVQGTTRTGASSLTAIGSALTVSKTGTYDVYYSAFRTNTSTSYTWATRLYIDGTAYGSANNTTWTNNQQNIHYSNMSLTANQVLRVYGMNTRGTSYYVCAPTITIIEA